MKQPKYLSCLLLFFCLLPCLQAQYINQLNDTWHDDALVDLQFNPIDKKPEALFKLGSGFNVVTYDLSTGGYIASKFAIVNGKVVTPKCMALAGSQCFVFSEDANDIYYTSLSANMGTIAYTISLPRLNPGFYSDLSPVDAVYDNVSTLHIVFSAKNHIKPTISNLVHMRIDVATGAILGGTLWGDKTWDIFPNDIEFVDSNHIYASGWRGSHIPIGQVYKHMVLPLDPGNINDVFDVVIPNAYPRSSYVKYINGKLYLVADNYLTSSAGVGPLGIIRLLDSGGIITYNGQWLYGSPGASFFIHDVHSDAGGNIVASGGLPNFSSPPTSSPRNFTFETGPRIATMNDYNAFLGGNKNIRTIFTNVPDMLFSVAKEDDMTLAMYDLSTNMHPLTIDCRDPLRVEAVDEQVVVNPMNVSSTVITAFAPKSHLCADSYKPYTLEKTCTESPTKAPAQAIVATSAMTISPNPTTGVVHLQHTEAVTQVRLYDPSGRLLMDRELPLGTPSTDLDLGPMPAGVYLLETETGAERMRTQLIRQ